MLATVIRSFKRKVADGWVVSQVWDSPRDGWGVTISNNQNVAFDIATHEVVNFLLFLDGDGLLGWFTSMSGNMYGLVRMGKSASISDRNTARRAVIENPRLLARMIRREFGMCHYPTPPSTCARMRMVHA